MTLDEIKDLVAWAYEKGAYEISVDGHSFKFPENRGFDASLPPNLQKFVAPHSASGATEQPSTPGASGDDFQSAAASAIRSQDPDEYAQIADQWANYRPLTNRP